MVDAAARWFAGQIVGHELNTILRVVGLLAGTELNSNIFRIVSPGWLTGALSPALQPILTPVGLTNGLPAIDYADGGYIRADQIGSLFEALARADDLPSRLGAWETDLDVQLATYELLRWALDSMDSGTGLLIVRDQAPI
jgi:hypothetical protein